MCQAMYYNFDFRKNTNFYIPYFNQDSVGYAAGTSKSKISGA